MRQPFGQNFLTSKTTAEKIVAAAEIGPGSAVLEIGPGKGALTSLLAHRAAMLCAVEIDSRLAHRLAPFFAATSHVRVVNADFLAFDLTALAPGTVIVGNLPYYCATALIEYFLPSPHWTSAVVMVQKEVGERIAAPVNSKAYNAFTLLCQYYARVELLFTVPPSAFNPPPAVESVVLRLANLAPPAPPETLFPLIKSVFQHRRKTMLNCLAATLAGDKTRAAVLLAAAHIPPDSRPQNVSLPSFLLLTNKIKNSIL